MAAFEKNRQQFNFLILPSIIYIIAEDAAGRQHAILGEKGGALWLAKPAVQKSPQKRKR